MPSLEAFDDFVISTGQKIIHSPDKILNDATRNAYLLSDMLKGKGAAMVVQSGERLRAHMQLVDAKTATTYSTNDDLEPRFADVMTTTHVFWRFVADHYMYTQQEVSLNSGNPQTYYTNLLKSKRQACKTSTYNFMEDLLWGTPDETQMETQGGLTPYSIPTFVTARAATGLPYQWSGSTLATIAPTVGEAEHSGSVGAWDNQRETYDSTDISDPDTGLVQAFDNMVMKLNFKAPMGGGGDDKYFENSSISNGKGKIYTSLKGRAMYLRLTRESNDTLVKNDLGANQGPGLGYHGIPVIYIPGVNRMRGYLANDSALVPDDQPVFFFLDTEYLFPVYHSDRYMVENRPGPHARQPFTNVVWTDTYYNFICTSRRRQGVVFADGSAAA